MKIKIIFEDKGKLPLVIRHVTRVVEMDDTGILNVTVIKNPEANRMQNRVKITTRYPGWEKVTAEYESKNEILVGKELRRRNHA
jgi:hypothetical protein